MNRSTFKAPPPNLSAELLPLPNAPIPSLLLVDDDAGGIQVLSRMLTGMGHLRFALSGLDALKLMEASVPDVVLVDAEMPGMNGFELCARMKADSRFAEVPIIFITSHRDVETEVAGFAAGAADFIRKPPPAEAVQARVRTQLRLKMLSDNLRRAALVDGLTGLGNRRRFDEQIKSECERARRTGDPLCMLMIDVDHFKRYNDHYGHVVGDACLRRIAEVLQSVVQRPADCVARYGGEEFTMLLPQTELPGAGHIAQQVVDAVAALHLPHVDSPIGAWVTVSVGAAGTPPPGRAPRAAPDPNALIDAADKALYEAKAAGRGRCMVMPLDTKLPSA